MDEITIGKIKIGKNHPCFIVAEAGANHDGDFNKAKQLVDAALETNASAIKFQHYTAGKLASKEAKRYWFVHGDTKGYQFDPKNYKESQIETFNKIDGIPREKDAELIRYAEQKGIVIFSTPFDFESVDHLDSLGTPMFKIASGDLTYHDFLRHVASKGKPVILSTGAATMEEIHAAVDVIKFSGNHQIILLHCTLAYPTPLEHANLLMMKHLENEFPDCLIGLSDHTPGVEADVAAAMLGAVMIEKHFTHTPGHAAGSDKVGDSPDHDIGIGKKEFTELVRRIRENEAKKIGVAFGESYESVTSKIKAGKFPQVLGSSAIKEVDSEVELKARLQARRSVVADRAIKVGTTITKAMLTDGTFAVKRPGTGIAPYEIGKLIGKVVKTDIAPDTVLTLGHFV